MLWEPLHDKQGSADPTRLALIRIGEENQVSVNYELIENKTMHQNQRMSLGKAILVAGIISTFLCGCGDGVMPITTGSASISDGKRVVVSITSDPKQDPQAVNMGLTLAGFCVEQGYEVAIFFNVKGVNLPTRDFDPDFQYGEHDPMAEQLKTLHGKGVALHVCPVCMKDLNIPSEGIIDEAFVTDKPKLFAALGSDTMVFSY